MSTSSGHAGRTAPGGHPHSHAHSHGDTDDAAELARILDLDAEVLAESWVRVHALARAAAPAARWIADLGAGTGTGTLALARSFPDAVVIAVDADPQMPTRVAAKLPGAPGVGERVRTLVADLDGEWPPLPTGGAPLDLAWASMSLHHLEDPDRALARVRSALRPGGALVTVEFAEPIRHLDGPLGEVEDRALATLRAALAQDVPHLSASWAPRLTAAGFDVECETVEDVDLRPPLPPAALEYSGRWLRRLARGLGDALERPDLTALLALAEPGALDAAAARGEVRLRGARTVTVARRS